MGQGLQKFMTGGGSTSGATDRVTKFKKLAKGKKTKEELRQLEKKLLVPEALPPYSGKKANPKPELLDKTIKIVFEKVSHAELFAKHFKVSHYLENSCYELDKLVSYLKELEKESDNEEEDTESTDHRRKQKVGKRKRRRKSVR